MLQDILLNKALKFFRHQFGKLKITKIWVYEDGIEIIYKVPDKKSRCKLWSFVYFEDKTYINTEMTRENMQEKEIWDFN